MAREESSVFGENLLRPERVTGKKRPEVGNQQRHSKDTLYQKEFDFDTPSGDVCPHGSGEGANPTTTTMQKPQAFEAWRDELNWEERILENVAHRYNLEYACQRVKSNKGAPGVDGRPWRNWSDGLTPTWVN